MKTITPDMHKVVNKTIAELKKYSPVDEYLRAYSAHEGKGNLLFRIQTTAEFPIMQGGGTDGKYLYVALVSIPKDKHQNGYIVKIDPQSGEVVGRSEVLEIDHANDITYDSKRNRIVVVHNNPRAHLLSFLDPETLEETDVVDIGRPIFCMSYNAKRNCFVVGKSGGQDFAILDADFKLVKDFTALSTRYTTQGMTSDDDYIYFVQSGKNVIMKYDWEGNFAEYLPVDVGSPREPESISFIGGKLYLAANAWAVNDQNEKKLVCPEVSEIIWNKTSDKKETVTPDMLDAVNEKTLQLKARVPVDEFLREYSEHSGVSNFLFEVPHFEGFPILQGGGTDGKYLYMAMVSVKKDDHQNGFIVKFDPQSGEVLAKSKVLEIDHANDITYDSVRNRLVVVHNAPRSYLLSLLDPETLEETDVVDIGLHIFCMTYNAKRNCFAVGKSGGQDFAILDADFQPVKHFEAVNTRYVTQGMTSDDDYLYFVQYRQNVIMKYDWDGNFVEYIPLDTKQDKEPESLSFIGGKWYVGYNTFVKKTWSTPVVAEILLQENK